MSFLYQPFSLEPAYAKGCNIVSKEGICYTDTFAGIGVNAFGCSFPPLLERLHEKLNRYTHLSNFLDDPDLAIVVSQLLDWTGQKGEVFFTNSGTEATEVALKVLLKARTGKRDKIIYFSGSFHGRTIGALAVNGRPSFRTPFEPLLPSTVELPWNNVQAFQDYLTNHSDEILGIILEPIQGSAGVIPLEKPLADAINHYKTALPFYLVCDEVQSGLGRTGTYFAYEQYHLKPDIILLGKALGGGLPLGATLLLGDCATILQPGDHGSTFAPNPVALAGARFLVEQLPGMLNGIKESADYLTSLLQTLPTEIVQEIRGKGLMIGLQLNRLYPMLSQQAFENQHLLLNIIGQHIIRLLPPLNVTKPDLEIIFEKLESAVKSL